MDSTLQKPPVSIDDKQSAKLIIKKLVPDIHADPDLRPSGFISKYWHQYQTSYESNNSLNGTILEELIAITLIRQDILPFYMQAKVAFIPNVNYDLIIYTKDIGPISLSAKTSLRERWKQADLEAVALKYIHRKSKSYVITLDKEAVRVRRADPSGAMGIDEFILADEEEYDTLLNSVKTHSLILSPTVQVVSSNIVVTSENYLQRYSQITTLP